MKKKTVFLGVRITPALRAWLERQARSRHEGNLSAAVVETLMRGKRGRR